MKTQQEIEDAIDALNDHTDEILPDRLKGLSKYSAIEALKWVMEESEE